MFTGIVQSTGKITDIEYKGDDISIAIKPDNIDMNNLSTGDSIAINGVCLTVVDLTAGLVIFDLSKETLNCTTFGAVEKGSRVNMEQSLRPTDRLDGHIVSGHVDAIAKIVNIDDDGRSRQFIFEVPESYSRYICSKGSICIDGVSLTVNAVNKNTFGVNIIPHTMQHTIFTGYSVGTSVNIEIDIITRYLEKLLQYRQ